MGLRLVVIPLSPIKDEVVHRLRRAVGRVCSVPKPHQTSGASIDRERLNDEEAARFDDGEPPIGWIAWWANKAQEIDARGGGALITLEPGLLGYRRVQPIDADALKQQMDSVIWTRAAGVVLAWGVPESAMNKRHFRRIPCAGAVGVHIDGCGAILMADPDTTNAWAW